MKEPGGRITPVVLVALSIALFLLRVSEGHTGWAPVLSGWYPYLSFTEEELDQVISSWNPCIGRVWTEIIGNGWIELHEVSSPSAFVFKGSGKVSINYVDDSWLISVPVDQVLCVPPYKPVAMLLIDGFMQIYRLRVEKSPGSTPCPFLSGTDKCKLPSTLPRKLHKPAHEFFFTASYRPQPDDLTLITCATIDRLLRIRQIAEIYQGPVSAAIFLLDKDKLKEDILILESYYLKYPIMQKYVDIHLLVEDGIYLFSTDDRPFPINILRTTALRYARTHYVMYIEADFVPNMGFRNSPSLVEVKSRLKENPKQVFIVFGLITEVKELCNWDIDITTVMPSTKADLQKWISPSVTEGVKPLSLVFDSHKALSFTTWKNEESIYSFQATPDTEPYYIGTRDYPPFGEIMIGCGRDKITHYDELLLAKYKFWIIPDMFIIHLDSTGMGSAWCQGFGADFPKGEAQQLQANWRSSHGVKGEPLFWWDASRSSLNSPFIPHFEELPVPTEIEDREPNDDLIIQIKELQDSLNKLINEKVSLSVDNENSKSNFKFLLMALVIISLLLIIYAIKKKTIFWTVVVTVIIQLTLLTLMLASR